MKKILVFALSLALVAPIIASADDNESGGQKSTTFSVTSVSPSTIDNNQASQITITGSGFSTIVQVGAQLGEFEDNERDDTDDIGALTNVTIVNDTTITATVPASADADDERSVTVIDRGVTPNTYSTLGDALTIHPSFKIEDEDGDKDGIEEVEHSNSGSVKAVFNLTAAGQLYKNKRWLKVRVGNRKAVITKITRTGGNSIVRVKVKYGKMKAGSYNVSLTYKNRLKKAVTRNSKTKYRTIWERGTMTNNNMFVVSGH